MQPTESGSCGCIRTGLERGWRGKGHEETLGDDKNGQYFDCGDGFTGVYIHMSKLIKLNTLNMRSLLYVKYTSK